MVEGWELGIGFWVWGLYGVRMGFIWSYMGSIWGLCGVYMWFMWILRGVDVGFTWDSYGDHMGFMWGACGVHVGFMWGLYGVWGLGFGTFLAVAWLEMTAASSRVIVAVRSCSSLPAARSRAFACRETEGVTEGGSASV